MNKIVKTNHFSNVHKIKNMSRQTNILPRHSRLSSSGMSLNNKFWGRRVLYEPYKRTALKNLVCSRVDMK